MILPDINLLIYAYHRDAQHHAKARFWETLLNGDEPVVIPWIVVVGFLRLMTHRSVLTTPLLPAEAIKHVRSWARTAGMMVS